MTPAKPKVAWTMSGDSVLGTTWRSMIRHGEAPMARAAWTNSRSRTCKHLAAGDARVADPAVDGEGEDEDADARGGDDGDDGEVEQDAGEGEQHVDDAHDHLVDGAAEVAGDGADGDADDQAERDDGERDPGGEARAPQELREQVAAVLVGAEQVGVARLLEQMTEVLRLRAVRRERRPERSRRRRRAPSSSRPTRRADAELGDAAPHWTRIRGSARP